MKIFKHLKSDWFRYGFETIAVIVGILVAFGLDNWNDERKTKIQSEMYAEKLIEDLIADTLNINRLIALCVRGNARIDSYFSFFDQGDHDLDVLLDSSENAGRHLFRYLPINYTFRDMQSSGNTKILDEAQRKSLIVLSGSQEFLQIIIEKIIADIKLGNYEKNKLLDLDRSKLDFYEVLSKEQDVNDRIQGLKLQHNVLTLSYFLNNTMIVRGEEIKEQSRHCIELLKPHQK